MDELSFEWDEEKNASNIKKHGVDFLDAALIFENPTIEDIDDSANYDEPRYIAIRAVQFSEHSSKEARASNPPRAVS
jgi:uncharacterized DUF497 family protein